MVNYSDIGIPQPNDVEQCGRCGAGDESCRGEGSGQEDAQDTMQGHRACVAMSLDDVAQLVLM